ncbi:MAG: class II aldolase/adducin family protein [Chloroflexi bacterium]|nr:class II aldolase/adducin family protein [Chloroflexota bacterium]MDA1145189.1 class II aldolase/adducin family protein [Chloroflexota bacterium]
MRAAGHPEHRVPSADTRVVLHVTSHDDPRPFRRGNAATFVVGIVEAPSRPPDLLAAAYPYLVRSLANLGLYLLPGTGLPRPVFLTLEQGVYEITDDAPDAYFDSVYDHVAPLALSRLVIANEFEPDLPLDAATGDEFTRGLARAGQRLDELGLLPAPFPLEEILGPRELRHVRMLFSIGGLSYGNLSVRRDASTFWMSGSGVDKSAMTTIGRDMLLVTGFDIEARSMRLSVPADLAQPARVSVDAIEHWMIYHRHPEVGAIVHAHAWMPDVVSTQINYPCGTIELANAVADLVAAAPEPGRAAIGQKNHGLTITGPNLDDIFDRIEGAAQSRVPMAA